MTTQVNWPAPAPDARIGAGLRDPDDVPERVDLIVIGLGVTGAGVALDAASRGLSVLAVDAHDLAFGTSRWSSKLVHGGLRYLAHGQVRVARESAVERGLLMEVTAPHLTRPLPMLLPLQAGTGRVAGGLAWAGLRAGDLLRRSARTDVETLPRPRRVGITETAALAPALRREGLRGGLISWDGQLEDDARLVTTLARTAAAHGAVVRTRVRAVTAGGREVLLRDTDTGTEITVRAGAVVSATGVWAGALASEVRLRPSQGTHLVLRGESLPGERVALTIPIPGSMNRFALVLPQPDGQVYVGLTDEPVDEIPDVPVPSESEIGFLLDVVGSALAQPLWREDVVGAYAGLRPLLDTGSTDNTADLSRRHAVLRDPSGLITVIGGKLTTYRQMAEDAVDTAIEAGALRAAPCRTRRLPLLGAAPRAELARFAAPARLVRRFGTEAALVLTTARELTGAEDAELLAPISDRVPVTLAELVFGVSHEGARSVEDLLHRRTRVSLVPTDLAEAAPAAETFAWTG